jgi:hypothetical protein
MTLGAWIFLSVLLLLVVLHKQFRKVFFWAVGIGAVCFGIFVGYSYLSEYLQEKHKAAEHAAFLKKVDECVTRLIPSGSAQPSSGVTLEFKDMRFLDGTTPASVCSLNPEITSKEAFAEHSPATVPIPEGATVGWTAVPDPRKKAPVEPKRWAVVSMDFVSLYGRCHFEAGEKQFDSNGCGVYDKETVAAFKKGDRVGVLSDMIRSSGGTDIYEVKFQKWTGWVDASDLTMEESKPR